ncbi:MAG: ribbon-helix-helix domain-containing protein [Vulcanisaeta sp.]
MVNPTITVRLGEEELRRLDELAQRMGKTRSDVIRSLINDLNEALRQEVEREKKRWVAMGFVGALESIILDPTLILRFVRKNVDVLGYPDFIIGMVRVKNRVVFFSHQDKIGHQLLQLVRSKVEEEVRREEAEIEQEEGEGEEVNDGVSAPAYAHVRTGVHPRTSHAIPVPSKYKLLINSRGVPPIARPTAAGVAGKPVARGGGGNTKPAVNTTVPEKQKSIATGTHLH